MTQEILTLQELAELLKLSDRTIYNYAQRGLIPGIKIGAAWRFRKDDVEKWLEDKRRITDESTSKKGVKA
ncbi:helix-turn-helix domain-containing protein [bacterium]|nr:helix-turn-helix domain-containing protein [bacterium]